MDKRARILKECIDAESHCDNLLENVEKSKEWVEKMKTAKEAEREARHRLRIHDLKQDTLRNERNNQ